MLLEHLELSIVSWVAPQVWIEAASEPSQQAKYVCCH